MWQEDLAAELKEANPRERKTVMAKYRDLAGMSEQHLYRVAAEYGFESGRKRRVDCGILKTGLTDRQIELVGALLYETGRENKGPIMPVERAIQIAEMNGYLEPGQVTPGTMNRILRERQMSKAHMKTDTPYTPMRSLHPNHTHVFDVSVCIQYYMKNGKMGIMDERDFYKNKFDNFAKIKTRLLRYVIEDHFSGAFKVRYYDTTGETADNLWNFLKWAWGGQAHEKLPFRGVPFILLMDTGSANKSHAILGFLERLGVEVPKGLPYNPRRQGSAETSHTIIEQWFESSLRIQPGTTEEQINAWACDMAAWHQAFKVHTRHGMPRTPCWLLIKESQFRELPEERILQEVYQGKVETRTVSGAYAIQWDGKEYNVKHVPGIHKDATVRVIRKLYKKPLIDVEWQGVLYEATPIETLPAIQGGFRADAVIIGQTYRAQPETQTQKAVKRFDNMAYGEKKGKKDVPFEGMHVFGGLADQIGVDFITKKGTPIEVNRGILETHISVEELLKRLFNQIGRIKPEINQGLRAQYGTSISVKEAEEVIQGIQDGTWAVEESRGMEATG
ncbi:MAG: hypothetical protein NTV58_12165 [Deltaproteobacteria bacterium]|nr:hypothetical protein [Deltaproteobacteria bacterium]